GRVQAADDVKLGDGFAVALARFLDALVDRHLVAAGLVDLLGPGAGRAVHPAEVGGIQISVDGVEGEVAVALCARVVGEATESQQVSGREQPHAVVEGKTLPGKNLFGEALECRPAETGEELRHGSAGFDTGW